MKYLWFLSVDYVHMYQENKNAKDKNKNYFNLDGQLHAAVKGLSLILTAQENILYYMWTTECV